MAETSQPERLETDCNMVDVDLHSPEESSTADSLPESESANLPEEPEVISNGIRGEGEGGESQVEAATDELIKAKGQEILPGANSVLTGDDDITEESSSESCECSEANTTSEEGSHASVNAPEAEVSEMKQNLCVLLNPSRPAVVNSDTLDKTEELMNELDKELAIEGQMLPNGLNKSLAAGKELTATVAQLQRTLDEKLAEYDKLRTEHQSMRQSVELLKKENKGYMDRLKHLESKETEDIHAAQIKEVRGQIFISQSFINNLSLFNSLTRTLRVSHLLDIIISHLSDL